MCGTCKKHNPDKEYKKTVCPKCGNDPCTCDEGCEDCEDYKDGVCKHGCGCK